MRQLSLFVLSFLALSGWAQDGSVITVNVENEAARRYLSEVYYTREDTSRMADYNTPPPQHRDIPAPAIVPIPTADTDAVLTCAEDAGFSEGLHTMTVKKGTKEAHVYNLTPQRTYYYKVTAAGQTLDEGEIHTEGQLRMLNIPGANNIRDMGGWPTSDGRRIKYGKLFRGSELNGLHTVSQESIDILKQQIGVQAELDLRANYDEGQGISAFGFRSNSSGACDYPPYYFTYNSGQTIEALESVIYLYRWKWEFNFIVNNLKHNRNVYFHCAWGGDRTGYLALLLEGLLGVEYSDLIKDYELSTLYHGIRVKERIDPVIDYIMALDGETLQEKFNTFFTNSIKATQANIDYFRSEMLEEAKSDDTPGENNPVTAIHTPRPDGGSGPAATYDLSGRKAGRSLKHGLLIETGHDGKARKMAR